MLAPSYSPKDTHKHRVTLNLPYTQGDSIDHYVDKCLFDNSRFTLRFLTIDDIQEVINCTDDPYLIEISVSGAFRNLRVDPKYGLKFGIKWGSDYYIDPDLCFSNFFLQSGPTHKFLNKDLFISFGII